jgi:hypothetical protein
MEFMNHPEQAVLFQYIADRLADETRWGFEAHLADCPACLTRVKTLKFLKENFEPIWSSWCAAHHGQAMQQWRLVQALAAKAQVAPHLVPFALRWLQQVSAGVEFSLQVLLDRGRRMAMTATQCLPVGSTFQLRPAFIGVGETALETHLKQSSVHLEHGRSDEAVTQLQQAVAINARATQSSVSQVMHRGKTRLELAVDSRRRQVLVKYWPDPTEPPPVFALLHFKGTDHIEAVMEFRRVEGELYLLAEFSDVPDGVWSLHIGPVAESPTAGA